MVVSKAPLLAAPKAALRDALTVAWMVVEMVVETADKSVELKVVPLAESSVALKADW